MDVAKLIGFLRYRLGNCFYFQIVFLHWLVGRGTGCQDKIDDLDLIPCPEIEGKTSVQSMSFPRFVPAVLDMDNLDFVALCLSVCVFLCVLVYVREREKERGALLVYSFL